MQTRGVRGQKIPKKANVICERPLNENFISTTLTLFNMVIIAIDIILRLTTRQIEITQAYFYFNPQQFTYNLRTDVQNNAVM